MAVTFTNNWKNILDKLESTLRAEFKGALPVCRGNKTTKATQYIRLVPISSELKEYSVSSEMREFSIQIFYYFFEQNIEDAAIDHITRFTSRVEALIHDNITMTLADGTEALDCRLESTELNIGDEEEGNIVEWDFKCIHLGNTG
tara:strand:- start:217 stop:651 length:435 start_codon:yes stop_codon:yes gene_type:complete